MDTHDYNKILYVTPFVIVQWDVSQYHVKMLDELKTLVISIQVLKDTACTAWSFSLSCAARRLYDHYWVTCICSN